MKKNMKGEINTQLKRFISLVIMGSIAVTSAISVAALSHKVNIQDKEKTLTLVTLNNNTDQILEKAGIELSSDDVVERNDVDGNINLLVKRAFKIKVTADGKTNTLIFADGTVEDAIKKGNIILNDSDTANYNLSDALFENMEICVTRMLPISLAVGGEEPNQVIVPEGTVMNAVDFLGITMSDDDALNVDKDSLVKKDMYLRLDRVEYREVKSIESIPYTTYIALSGDINEGETKITGGEEGQKEVTNKQKIVNGNLVEITELSSQIIKDPKSGVKTIGTKRRGSSNTVRGYSKDNKNGTFTDHNGNVVSYSSLLTGSGTAYTAESGARTASGRIAQYGCVAVNPNIIPYGTKLYICSADGNYIYGYAIAADTGGALMDGSALVDLYYDTLDECYQFGRRTVNVYVLN